MGLHLTGTLQRNKGSTAKQKTSPYLFWNDTETFCLLFYTLRLMNQIDKAHKLCLSGFCSLEYAGIQQNLFEYCADLSADDVRCSFSVCLRMARLDLFQPVCVAGERRRLSKVGVAVQRLF